MDIKGVLEQVRPDTDNLIVLAVTGIIVYSIAVMPKDALSLANTGIGGLLGYLGATAKSAINKNPNPPDLVTGIKP